MCLEPRALSPGEETPFGERMSFPELLLVFSSLSELWLFSQVSLELNPGLKPPSELPAGAALVHVRALGPNDTLHFLLCTSGAPALLLVHCNSTDSELRVDWPRFNSSSPGSLRVVPESSVQYSTALVITRLWEYDDLNNTADPEKTPESNFYPPYDLHSFTWRELNITANESSPVVTVCGGDNTGSFSNGSLCLQFSAYEAEGRDGAWPSLLHHANSSQLRVYLSGIAPRGNDSRFAVELQSISEAGAQGRVSVRSSIDDEYTPSIFKVSEWLWSPLNSSRVSGFTQWKPVAYRKANPVFEDATPCKHSSPEPQEQIPRSALVRGYFREKPEVQALNISFGIAEEPDGAGGCGRASFGLVLAADHHHHGRGPLRSIGSDPRGRSLHLHPQEDVAVIGLRANQLSLTVPAPPPAHTRLTTRVALLSPDWLIAAGD
ncbi:hypothetical protein DNTS_032900 [Danionella cerebrum]|uniref:Uncharacterized protein n=1 Tax=Danionella cerebrum TaxID=2873325 RepID=A0A553R5E6_9TELE|nr:hypothetical protein DNTS_032900 [Danionella translucida]